MENRSLYDLIRYYLSDGNPNPSVEDINNGIRKYIDFDRKTRQNYLTSGKHDLYKVPEVSET